MDPNQQPPINSKKLDKSAIIGLSFELGYIIAIPLVVLGLLGKWVDNRFQHNFPWVTLIGIALAITATVIWITKRLSRYIK